MGKSFLVWGLIAVFTASVLSGFGQMPAQASVVQAVKRDVVAPNGVVAAAHPLAAQAGLEVLKKGGNAFDAAIATAFTLNVVEPNASGIGGGGFALLYSAAHKRAYVIDFREQAPAKARPDFYRLDEKGRVVNNASVTGYYATGIPGNVAGMETLHKKFGTMEWAELLKPAIKYAEEGVTVSKVLNGLIKGELDRMQQFPSLSFFQKTYLKDGLPLEVGDKLVNKDLANTLRKIAKGGAEVFYRGEIADAIAKEFAKGSEWITKEDLANYKAIMREPVNGSYRGYTVVSVPPPSSGGTTLIQILNILEGFDLKKMGQGSADYIHTMIEAQRLAFADRARYMADPGFVSVPVAGLSSKAYAEQQRKRISMTKANNAVEPGDPSKYESGSTTSFSIIDKEGNMITVTHSINNWFGSGVVPEGTGILMNCHMDDFVPKPGSVNSMEAGKRPLSSMSPTLVIKDSKPVMAIGSPGATRIISAVSEVICNVIDFDMDMQEAIAAPRFHNQNGPTTMIESRIAEEVRKELEKRGHKLTLRGAVDLFFGGAQGVLLNPTDGRLHGGADPRRDGVAVGY